MPTKRTVASNNTSSERSSIKTRTVTLKVPENRVLGLVGGLMVISFLLGVLGTNLAFKLEGNKVLGTTTGTQAAAQPGAPAAPVHVDNLSSGHFPALGDANAKVTVVEFADFRCPFCEQLFKNVSPQLQKDYIDTGKVKFYFRQYAFLGPASTVAANAAECANDQGKFWEFHDWLYNNQPPETDTTLYTVDKLTQVAGDLGMNTTQFSDCLTNNKFQSKVDQDLKEGQAAGVSGTPATFINGTLISGAVPYEQFKSAIDAELAK